MPFKHKSGSRKGQKKKEQEEKAAKPSKLDYFGFLTSHQLVASQRSQQCSSSAGIRIAASALSGVSATMQQLTVFTVRNVPAESETRLSSLCTYPSLLKYVRLIN